MLGKQPSKRNTNFCITTVKTLNNTCDSCYVTHVTYMVHLNSSYSELFSIGSKTLPLTPETAQVYLLALLDKTTDYTKLYIYVNNVTIQKQNMYILEDNFP